MTMICSNRSSSSTPKSITGDNKTPSSSYRSQTTTTLFFIIISLSFFTFFSLYSSPNAFYRAALFATTRQAISGIVKHRHHESIQSIRRIRSEAVLWPGWEILVIVSPEEKVMPPIPGENYTCFYPNGEISKARFAAFLSFTNRSTFRCSLPGIYRHHHPIPTPIFASSKSFQISPETLWPDLPLWNFVVFEAISTENDVVLFVKGPNRGLGSNKPPESFRCVFGDESDTAIRTTVTSSVQEVFRCNLPNTTIDTPIKIYLETTTTTTANTVPSVAYFSPKHKLAKPQKKSLICATTMVYNVAKYLREWIIYHAKIGIQRFIIYDNESDDELNDVVESLNRENYDVIKIFWIWPKTQEAGFSHAAVYGNDTCTWMMYLDVDEFLFSPVWENQSKPSDQMIRSLLPPLDDKKKIGQVSFKSLEFGPSNQTMHPRVGVTQGYTCRREEEQRHKSIVRLSAVEHSLYTAIHHFGLKEEYEWRVADTEEGVVNHYKYQAWPEFKAKFKRRVSAYVVDWTRVSNPKSRDRTPGLGFRPIEPEGWVQRFCEVIDLRLKKLTKKWFGYPNKSGYIMAWQKHKP